MKKISALLILSSFITTTHADNRIQIESYDANRVYRIYTKVGRTTLIQLEEGETLSISPSSVLGMGDAEAWNLSVRGNNILFKQTQAKPQTNMIVVTNKRTYTFDLESATKGQSPTYILRFEYPDTQALKAQRAATREKLSAAVKAEKIFINTEYFWRGDNAMLKPTAAWDDGRFTRLVYDHAGELPVFFKVLPDGTETLINTSIDPVDKKTILLQEVIRTIRARLGNEVIELINRNYKLPKFNTNRAGLPGSVRVEKGIR